jgi:hypothetical protein
MKTSRKPAPAASLNAGISRMVEQPVPAGDAREKGSKSQDTFEVWHHHASLRHPSEWALMLQFDQRR